MQTGIISFGDRVAWNIKCNQYKDKILNEIYNLYGIRIIQKHYFKLDDTNIKHLSKLPHLISLRTNGNRYYIYFSKYNDVEIIYFIDMKIHTGYEKPRIILARGLFNKSLFSNTLIEGEMVKTKENKWIFFINDIIAYQGKKLDDIILPERLKIIYDILENQYKPDPICDICSYKVKSYYYASKSSLDEIIEKSKTLNYSCRGIYFYSFYMKHRPKLFNFDENVIVSVHKKVKDITEFKLNTSIPNPNLSSNPNPLPKPQTLTNTFIITSNIQPPQQQKQQQQEDGELKELWLAKTDDADIYYLYDNFNILTSNKIGIALVPTLKDSIHLRNLFKDKNLTYTIKYKCKYNKKFNKYQPIEMI